MILDSLDGLHTIAQCNLSIHAEYCVIEYNFHILLNFAPLQMWTPYSWWVNFPLFIFLCAEFSAAVAAADAVFLNLPGCIQNFAYFQWKYESLANNNALFLSLYNFSLFSIHHTIIFGIRVYSFCKSHEIRAGFLLLYKQKHSETKFKALFRPIPLDVHIGANSLHTIYK